MRAYHIQQDDTCVDFYTTDFMDVWNELEIAEPGSKVTITPLDITVLEFNDLIKNNINGPKSTD